jgi:DnaA family protein
MLDQLTLGIRLQDEANFDSYFAGENQEVVAILKEFVDRSSWPCIYIAGNKGAGKSHLLQASSQLGSSLGLQTFYLPMKEDLSPQILEDLDVFSLVCLDNLEIVAGNLIWEEAIFHFFNRALQSKTRLLFAGEKLPRALSFLMPDLSSRLASGITYFLKPLNDNDKLQLLKLRARIRGFELNDDVGQYLLNHYPRDMCALLELFELLDQASLAAQHRLTIPFVKSVLPA